MFEVVVTKNTLLLGYHTGVNFINVLRARFSYKILAPKLQSCVLGLKLEKSWQKMTFIQKMRV
jgi:hypothetical protein